MEVDERYTALREDGGDSVARIAEMKVMEQRSTRLSSFLTALILLALCIRCLGQNEIEQWGPGTFVTVAGSVKDGSGHEAVEAVTATLSGNVFYQTQTDPAGVYIFYGVRAGKYALTLNKQGYVLITVHNLEIKGLEDVSLFKPIDEFYRFDCEMYYATPGGPTWTIDQCADFDRGGTQLFRGNQSWLSWEPKQTIKQPSLVLFSGKIVDTDGAGISDVDITATGSLASGQPYLIRTTTRKGGAYSFLISNGDYKIEASKGGYFSIAGTRRIQDTGFVDFSGVLAPSHSDPLVYLRPLRAIWKILAVQAALWVLLIFFYPYSTKIQAFFFWNRWARKAFGLAYVDFCLTWVPFLRNRLLAPFRDDLTADAQLEDHTLNEYFYDVDAVEGNDVQPQCLNDAVPAIIGQIVLEGESGLGKSMFLRVLVGKTQVPITYLRADSCEAGVLEAIQLKLKGKASDQDFIKSIIYSGGLIVVIDGLNEVSTETRERIRNFAVLFPRANILLASQPMLWKRPPRARILSLLPLGEAKIQRFLQSRYPSLDSRAAMSKEEYDTRCSEYLYQRVGNAPTEEDRRAALLELSNPMDLTTAADIIATGTPLTRANLQEQQFEQMSKEYSRVASGQSFPLRQFAESVYQNTLQDVTALDDEHFFSEIQIMVDSKMVLEQHSRNTRGEEVRKWVFRHEKIRDFFLIKALLEQEVERLPKHLEDPRFRNVYLILASSLPLEQAKELKEALVDHAAQTKDHVLSDAVVQVLRVRRQAANA
jgi:hypothetical protein